MQIKYAKYAIISPCLYLFAASPAACHHHTTAATDYSDPPTTALPSTMLRRHQRGYAKANRTLSYLNLTVFITVYFSVRHGGIDADAKCPDASAHNAQYDAERHASYVATSALLLCPSNDVSWAGTHKHTHTL